MWTEITSAFVTHTMLQVREVPAAVADSATMPRQADARRSCHSHEMLRVGELAMDDLTGATSWRGKTPALPGAERERLHVFVRRAGQIINRERLDAYVGIDVAALDGHVQALRAALRSTGSTRLPYAVDGLGYVLWRG